MLQKLTVNKWIKLLILISIITYLYFVMRMVHLRGYDDDHVFLTIFHSGNVVEQLLYRFNSWSGRLAIEVIMLFTIGYSFLWKLGIGLSIIVLCFACCRISRLNPGIINIAFALILFAAIPAEINADASWWITGFYNYLLPVSVALYVFSVSFCMKKSIPEKIICIILAFYFPYMEQAGIAFIFAIICLIFARRKKVSYFDITILIIVLVNLIICLKAPGNERRFILETWTWYPQYQTYGIINKLSLGFDKLHQLMTLKYNIPLIAFCSILFYLRSTFSNMSLSVKMAMFFIATFISISIANSLTGILSGSLLFGGVIIDATRWYAVKLFISYFYLSIIISSILTLLIDCQLHQKIKSTPIIAIMIRFMTVTMMGLSPTVYASGLRVDFIFEIACIISCMSIAYSLKKQ